jgi:hypothetical protein
MTNIENKHKQPEEMLLTVAATITEEEMRSMISNDQLGELIKTQNNRDEPDIKHHQHNRGQARQRASVQYEPTPQTPGVP